MIQRARERWGIAAVSVISKELVNKKFRIPLTHLDAELMPVCILALIGVSHLVDCGGNNGFWRETAANAYVFAVAGTIAVDAGRIFYAAGRTLLDKVKFRDIVYLKLNPCRFRCELRELTFDWVFVVFADHIVKVHFKLPVFTGRRAGGRALIASGAPGFSNGFGRGRSLLPLTTFFLFSLCFHFLVASRFIFLKFNPDIFRLL